MKGNDRPLKDVVLEILKKYRLQDHLEETRLVRDWENVAGKLISSHTSGLHVKDGILFVRVDSSALRQELQYRKEKLIDLLNINAGKVLIREIIFR
jgi:predicted nucleic acid-binding Zn ribbon protein